VDGVAGAVAVNPVKMALFKQEPAQIQVLHVVEEAVLE